MKTEEALRWACQESSLNKALARICLWESERIVKEAHEFLSGRKPRNSDGTGWSTCFEYLINRVTEQYNLQPDSSNAGFSNLPGVGEDIKSGVCE